MTLKVQKEICAGHTETIVEKDLVSIVIPTYDRPESLKTTLETIFCQSYRNFEVIVVDDGSHYDVAEAIKEYPVQKLIHLPHSGSNVARNMGYQHTRGEYLLFCDDDVELDTRFLEKMVEALQANGDKGYAYCGFDLDGNILAMRPFSGDELRNANYINTVSLIRRSSFPGFDPIIKRLQDWDLWLTMLKDGYEGVWVPEVLFKTSLTKRPAISDDWSSDSWTYAHAYEVVARKHGLPDLARALEALMRVYGSREDLQTLYPECKVGDYRRLIEWAADIVARRSTDSALSDLSPYREWYVIASRNASKTAKPLELESEKQRLQSEIADRDSRLVKLESRLFELESERQRLQNEISVIRSSLGYRFMRFYASVINRMFPDGTRRGEFRNIVTASLHIIVEQGFGSFRKQAMEKIRRREFRLLRPKVAFPSSLDPYLQWLDRDRITKRVLTLMKSDIESFSVKPKFSILMPVFNSPVKFLRDAIDSVLAQIYPRYELCICDNGSNDEVKSLLRSYEKADSRIKICTNPTNLGISKGLNEAFKIATGEFIGLLDHDDVLDRASLYYVAKALNGNPHLDVIYTDRDHIDDNGMRCDPYFKPDWSPHTILSHNYVIHFLVVRADLLKDAGGFRKEFDGSQDYDLILRLPEKTAHIAHIPRVLYSWRRHRGSSSVTPRMIAYETALKAISEALHRRGAEATVTKDTRIGPYKVFHEIKGRPLVSIIISSLDVKPYLEKCISSIVEKSTYSNYEIIVATNNPSSLNEFCSKNNIELLLCEENSFYSQMNNQAAKSANGDFLVFLSDDVVVKTPGWIEEMLQLCQLPEVGAVGPMQITPDGRILCTSFVSQLAKDGEFYHFSPHAWFQMPHLFGFSSNVISDVSSISRSCMMIKRQLFMSLGGFDSDDFALLFQDLDMCYKLLDLGLYNVYTPYAVLIRSEAGSKCSQADCDSEESILGRHLEVARRFCKKYQKRLLAGDKFFNRNLCGPEAFLSPRPLLTYEVGDQYGSSYWTNYGFPLMKKGEAIATRESRVKGVCKSFAESVLKATGCKKVIDIGCGLAENVEAFQDLGVHAVGVELSSAALAQIPEKIRSHIILSSITDANTVSLLVERGEKRFDVALAIEVLEHIPMTKIDVAITNIRSLADIVIITTPKPNLWDNEDTTHVCVKPTSFWIDRFLAAGFEADETLRSKIFGMSDLKENQDCTRVVLKRRKQ